MITCQRLLNSRETDVAQIRSTNTWIARIYLRLTLSLCILLIVALLHTNQGMLTCSTVRTKDSWQNDWSQDFRLCDQEGLPCHDTCVKVPYQSHIRHNECGPTSAAPATHYFWVQMCLSMSYVFILQCYWLRLLAQCCNPTNHLKQMPYRDEYNFQVVKSPRMSVTSMMRVLWFNKFHGKLGRRMSHCVQSILSMSKKKYDQPTFCLMATQVVLLQKRFPLRQSEPMEVHFCWVMEWRHILGLIRSILKKI